jgi:uncharacterized protein YndB with AHSA1/START domain
MSQIVCSADMAAPPATVFFFMEDPAHHVLWMEDVEESRTAHMVPDGVGTRIVHLVREGRSRVEYRGEIIGMARPTYLALRVGHSSFQLRVDFRLAPTSTGTRVDLTCDPVEGSLLVRLVMFLFGWTVKGTAQRSLQKLGEIAAFKDAEDRSRQRGHA